MSSNISNTIIQPSFSFISSVTSTVKNIPLAGTIANSFSRTTEIILSNKKIIALAALGVAAFVALAILGYRLVQSLKAAENDPQTPVNAEDDSIICAPAGMNQYNNGAVSACLVFALGFLADNQPATPQGIVDILKNNKDHHTGAGHLDIYQGLSFFKEQLKRKDDVYGQYDIETYNYHGNVEEIFRKFAANENITLGLLCSRALAISVRKHEDFYEFFDSHGLAELTPEQGNVVYIKRCKTEEEALAYLRIRFPEIEGIPEASYPQLYIGEFYAIEMLNAIQPAKETSNETDGKL